jgi:hypothetical protein
MSGRQYTWAGPGDNPTYEKLDRVLVNTEWGHKYPLVTVESRDRNLSDHTALILNTGASTHQNKQPTFKFARGWLTRDGFFNMVTDIWQSECRGSTALEKWQNKIRNLRQYLRGWAKHMAGMYKKEKEKLSSLLDQLDKKTETSILSDNEINMNHYLKERLATLLRGEEIKWYERAKVQNLLQGDDNTHFFHLIASDKCRKQHIFRLEQEDGIIVGDNELKRYITSYYKNLFGQHVERNISLDESRIDDIPQVTENENEILISPFTMDEIKEVVLQMEHNKAPGPDCFLAEFYHIFWEIIKEDLLALFSDFYEERLPLFSLNFGVITLIPKIHEAKQIQQYKPICVLNVSFKIFTKVGTNRLKRVADTLVSPSQTAFMPGRNIMEGVVILHETIHELDTRK